MITLELVKELGFVLSGERAWHRGYVTRKQRSDSEIEVFAVPETGRTKRRRQLYYLEPAYNSTKYCIRVYLDFPSGWVIDASWYENVKLRGCVDLEEQKNYPRSLSRVNGAYYSEENTCKYGGVIMIADMHTYLAIEERIKSFAEDYFDLDHDMRTMFAYHDAKILLHFAENAEDRAQIATDVMKAWGV